MLWKTQAGHGWAARIGDEQELIQKALGSEKKREGGRVSMRRFGEKRQQEKVRTREMDGGVLVAQWC